MKEEVVRYVVPLEPPPLTVTRGNQSEAAPAQASVQASKLLGGDAYRYFWL